MPVLATLLTLLAATFIVIATRDTNRLEPMNFRRRTGASKEAENERARVLRRNALVLAHAGVVTAAAAVVVGLGSYVAWIGAGAILVCALVTWFRAMESPIWTFFDPGDL